MLLSSKEKNQCTKAHFFACLSIYWLQYFDRFPLKVSTSCRHSIRKVINASRRVLFVLILDFWLQSFDCRPFKISPLMSSSKKNNYQCIKVRLFCFWSTFWLQYFDCLSLSVSIFMSPLNKKWISAPRRIFWNSFQQLEKNGVGGFGGWDVFFSSTG